MSPEPVQPVSPGSPPPPPSTLAPVLPAIPSDVTLHDPPPPYPSRERRSRQTRRTRRNGQISSAGTESEGEPLPSGREQQHAPFPPHASSAADDISSPTETTPLLTIPSTTIVVGGSANNGSPRRIRRQRTTSETSTVFSAASASPSLAQTVVSAFHLGDDSDEEDYDAGDEGRPSRHRCSTLDAEVDRLGNDVGISRREGAATVMNSTHVSHGTRWKRYFRPMWRRSSWAALFHLLVLNFPFALFAWIYLFVFTLLGTTLLVALPLGAVLCFFDLLGARTLARGEVVLQSTFHKPLAYELEYPLPPIFTRMRPPTAAEVESGVGRLQKERSFYRNTYSMFSDGTSYFSIFYFLVIKPAITILLSLFLLVIVPISLNFVLPAPWMLRLVRRLGTWQANIAVEGLYLGGR